MDKIPSITIVPAEAEEQQLDEMALLRKVHYDVQAKILKQFADLNLESDRLARTIADEVMVDLKKEGKEVLLKMIGFSNKWGTLDIDHCNGRSGGSVIGDITRSDFKNAAIKFIEDNASQIFAVNKKQRDQIVDRLRSSFILQLKDHASIVGREVANEFLRQEADAFVNDFKQTKLLKIANQLSS